MLLSLPEVGPEPVAFAVQHVVPGEEGHVAPLFVGLDYESLVERVWANSMHVFPALARVPQGVA